VLGYALRFRRRRIRSVARDETDAVTRRSALVLAPHPDDETLGCGAVILRKVAAGTPVTVVVVADGRHSHRSEYLTPEGVGALRHAEMVEVARRLGLASHSLRQLGFEDRTLTGLEDELVETVADLIAELNPEEVYVTGAFEPHPDHSALGRATRRALERLPDPPLLMEYPIWMWSQVYDGGLAAPLRTRFATAKAALDLLLLRRKPAKVCADEFVAGKLHALDAHASQLGRPAGVPADEHWWALPRPLLDAASDSVELFVPWRPRLVSRGARSDRA
jgi:LmbE family N-acetylglucosaminyl deacetylase